MNSPCLVKGGIVIVGARNQTGEREIPLRVMPLQYNPDTLSRTLQVQGVGSESGDRSEGPAYQGTAG